MDLINSNSTEFRNFYFSTVQMVVLKFSPEVEKCRLNSGTSKSSKLKILLYV